MTFAKNVFWAESMKIKTKGIKPEYLREYLENLFNIYENVITECEFSKRKQEEAFFSKTRARWADIYSENLSLANDVLKSIESALLDHGYLK